VLRTLNLYGYKYKTTQSTGEHCAAVVKTEDNKEYFWQPYNLPEVGDVRDNLGEWVFNDIPLQSRYSSV